MSDEVGVLLKELHISVKLIMREVRKKLFHLVEEATMEDSKQQQCIQQNDELLKNFKNLAIEVKKDKDDEILYDNLVIPAVKQKYLKTEAIKHEFVEIETKAIKYELEENSTDTESDCLDDIEADEEEELSFGIPIAAQSRGKITGLFRTINAIPDYLPCAEIQKAHQQNFTRAALAETNINFRAYLKYDVLHSDNIHIIYKNLLEMEDMTTFSEYQSLTQKNATIDYSDNSVQLKNVANVEDILMPFMDNIVFKINETSEQNSDDIFWPYREGNHISASIKNVTKNWVYFRLRGKQRALVRAATYCEVAFRPSRMPMRYQHHALKLLEFNSIMRQYLFPCCDIIKDLNNHKPSLTLVNANIAKNPEQLQAVENIVANKIQNAPYIIFGPPGTGKTTTVVETILQLRLLNTASRILVTAGSNSACDTIALRICQYFNSNNHGKLNEFNIMRVFSKSVQQKGLDKIPTILLQNSNCSNGIQFYPAVEYLRRYGIIVATLCTVGKLVSGNIGDSFFTHIFIDEAGASTEPETLIGIAGIKSHNCHVILSGDHRQLGPILKSQQAKKLGLEQSMMERLLARNCYAVDENGNYNRTLQTRLRRNYRSHSEIVRLYNHLYYNNELIAQATNANANLFANWKFLKNPQFPIIFQAVHGQTMRNADSASTYNELEIEVLMWYLRRLLIDGIEGKRVIKQSDIGIVTPYKAQYRHIQDQLCKRNWQNIEVGTVETFQGREKTIIIGSLVRSFKKLGFSCERRRLNVLLSRAKSLLILIGNPLTLNQCADFKFIIDECQSKGTVSRKKKSRKHVVEDLENNQNALNIK